MALIAELGAVFGLAAALALIFQLRQRMRYGRDWGKVAHYTVVFGLAIMTIYFLGLVFTDLTDLRPEG